jgi:hypothetical protein
MLFKNRSRLFLCNAITEGGDAGGGAGAPGNEPAPAKTFTQDEFNSLLGKRLAEERKKFADYDQVKERHKQLEETSAEMAKRLEELELKGKTSEEREKHAAEKASKRIEQERSELTTKLTAAEQRAEAAEKRYRTKVVDGALGEGLDTAKVFSSARSDAIRLLREESKIELDDDGKVISIEYGGILHKTAAEAAAAFLSDREYLAAGEVPKGGGTKSPNGGGAGALPANMAAVDQIAAGLAARK